MIIGAGIYGSMYYYATRVKPVYEVYGVVPVYAYETNHYGYMTVM